MATVSTLEFSNVTVDKLYTDIIAEGVSRADAAILAGNWIIENLGRTQRRFSYGAPLAEEVPECISEFARTFAHVDWFDGESVVQAEETASEEGFNRRFHSIEADIDGLGADVAKAFACMAALRQSLAKLLEELRTEINRVNGDIFECCKDPSRPTFPYYPGVLGAAGTLGFGQYMGTGRINERDMMLWSTPSGVIMLPSMQAIGIDITDDHRVARVATLANYVAESRDVQTIFRGRPVTRAEFIKRFGAEDIGDGVTVVEAIEILPLDARFGTVDEMVDAVIEAEAAVLRTTTGGRSAVADAFGVETEGDRVADASLEKFRKIPPKARAVLIQNGIDTMAKFIMADTAETTRLLSRAGIKTAVGEVAGWSAMAGMLVRIRQ